MLDSSSTTQRTHELRRHRSEAPARPVRKATDRWQLVLDALLIAILAIAPLVFGGRYEGGKAVMVALVVAAMCVCAVRFAVDRSLRWHCNYALWLVAAGVLLLALQLVPRGGATVSLASLLPTWSGEATDNPWTQASLFPSSTRGGIVMLLAYGGLFFVAIQRLQTIEDVEWILTVIGWTAVGMAGFALIQYLTSNGRFWWFYEHPWRDTSDVVKGPFDNRNHFAHFLALGCGPLIWWWLRRANSESTSGDRATRARWRTRTNLALLLGGLAVSVVLFAAFMTFSRAGCVLILFVVVSTTISYLRLGWISKQLAAALVGVVVLVVAALWIHGHDRLANRLDDYAGASLNSLDRGHARRKIWAANMQGISHNGVLGAGVGSHRYLYPVYLKDSPATEYTHAESGYLQVLLETGWIGLALLLFGVAAISGWVFSCWNAGVKAGDLRRIHACLVPLATGLTASVLHSFVDFVWYISACMALTIVLAACAFRLHTLSHEAKHEKVTLFDPPRWLRWSIASMVMITGLWMVHDRFGPAVASRAWDTYLCVQGDEQANTSTAADTQKLDASIAALERVVRWHPQHARANLRLAGVYLQKFQHIQDVSDNALPIAQLREAVIRTDFASLAKGTAGKTQDDLVATTRKLRDQWFERTLQFHVLASETISEFDTDADGVLAAAEVRAAQEKSDLLANATLANSSVLTAENIAAAYRAKYHDAYQYLYKALDHTRRGLAACPLQGEGYLLLAELCFLEDDITSQTDFARRKRTLVNQALRLRPWDGDVLLVAGKEALLANHLNLATKLWRRAFQSGSMHRNRLIEVFVSQQIPLDFIAQQFAPVLDAAACDMIAQKYASAQLNTESNLFFGHMASVARHEAQTAQADAVKCWLLAYKASLRLGDQAAQTECAKMATACEPNDYGTRRRLAGVALEQKLYAGAEPHVRWCLRREPNDRGLRKAVMTILDARSQQKQRVRLVSGESELPPNGGK